MVKGFKISKSVDVVNPLIEYRNNYNTKGKYLGWNSLDEHYSMQLGNVTDWTGYPMCFTKNQLVIVKGGSKIISEIEIGDEVLCFNHEKNIEEYKKVINNPKHITTKKVIRIKMKDGTIIECTDDHKFFDGKKYTKIIDLINKKL